MENLNYDIDPQFEFSFGFIANLENEAKYVQTREDYHKLIRYYTIDVFVEMAEYTESNLTSDSERLLFWELQKRSFKFVSIQYSTSAVVPNIESESDMKSRCDMILSHIENQIEVCKLYSNDDKEFEQERNESFPFPPITPQQTQQIAYLHEFGVLEFLRKRFKNESNSTIAHYVSVVLGIPHQSIKTAINRLYNGGIDSKNLEIAKKFIADKKNIPVPLPEIKFDKDIEGSEK